MLTLVKNIQAGDMYCRFLLEGDRVVYVKEQTVYQEPITREEPAAVLLNAGFYIDDLRVSRDGKQYFISSDVPKGAIWDKETGETQSLQVENKEDPVCTCVGEAPNGNVLLATQNAQHIYEVSHFDRRGNYLGKYYSGQGPVRTLVCDEKDRMLVALSEGYGMSMWNEGGLVISDITDTDRYRGPGPVMSMSKLSDSEYAIACGRSILKVRLAEWDNAKTLATVNSTIRSLATTPNRDKVFCSTCIDVFVVTLSTGKSESVYTETEIRNIEVSKDGKYLALLTKAGIIRVFEISADLYA